jgi:hypothetical protein
MERSVSMLWCIIVGLDGSNHTILDLEFSFRVGPRLLLVSCLPRVRMVILLAECSASLNTYLETEYSRLIVDSM